MDLEINRCRLWHQILSMLTLGFAVLIAGRSSWGSTYTFDGSGYTVVVPYDAGDSSMRFCGSFGVFYDGCRDLKLTSADSKRFQGIVSRIDFDHLNPLYANRSDQRRFTLCRDSPQKCVRVEDPGSLPVDIQHMDSWIVEALKIGPWIYGSVAVVRQLKAEGFDFNARDPENQSTMLIRAARWSDANVVGELLKAGAKTEFEDDFGNTALSAAANAFSPSVAKVRLLIDAGANVCRKWGGHTLLQSLREAETRWQSDHQPVPMELRNVERLLADRGGECGSK